VTTPIEQTLPQVPAGVPGDWVADNLAELQEMNGESWQTLEEGGVEPAGGVRISYAFTAQNEEQAGDLADELLIADGYEAHAAPPNSDFEAWTVSGTTDEVTVTQAGLDEWLRRMIAIGWQHGESTLDGWSAVLG
jgi:hypothetical protein